MITVRGKWGFAPKTLQTQVYGIMLSLEGQKKFEKDGRFRFMMTPYNIRKFQEAGMDVGDPYSEDQWEDEAPSIDLPAFRPPKQFWDPLNEVAKDIIDFEHQDRFFNTFKDVRSDGAFVAALFAEMGTGKTKMAIDLMNYHFCKGRIEAVIVLAKKGVHEQWSMPKVEAGKTIKQSPVHMFTQRDIRMDTFVWGDKTPNNEMPERMLTSGDGRLKWAFFTFEAYTSKKAASLIREFCRAHKGKIAFIGDETHKLKTPDAKRTEYATKVAHFCQVRLIMTGTPIAKDLVDEYSQFRVLAPSVLGHEYVTTFKSEFCTLGGFTGRDVIGPKNVEKFKALTSPYVFRITKKECLDLPEKQYSDIVFKMTQEQKTIIDEIKSTGTYQVPGGELIEYETAMGAMGAIQQVSNGFLMCPSGEIIRMKKNPRVEAFADYVSDTEEKFILWAKYHADMDVLLDSLGKEQTAFYYGPLSDAQRKRSLDEFLDPNSSKKYLCLTAATGAEGIDGLQSVCSTAFYYSNTFNSIERWQSEDRIHRIGMGDKALYIDMIAEASIDRLLIRNLMKKKALATLVLDTGRDFGMNMDIYKNLV